MDLNMNLNQLRVFHVAAQEQSFTRAADKLHLTQPGVSKHIKDLEEYYATPLFDRLGKRLILTNAGNALFEATQKIFRLIDETAKRIDDLEDLHSGHLSIGASITLGSYILLPFIKEFRNLHPQIEVVLDVSLSQEVVSKVLDDKLDIGFVGAEVKDGRLFVEAFTDDELLLVVPPDHPWAAVGAIDARALETEQFIVSRSGSGTRTILEDRLKDLDLRLSMMEFGHTESVKMAVEGGLGVSILSRAVVERELRSGWLKAVKLEGIDLKRKLYFVHHKDKYLSKSLKAFMLLVMNGTVEKS